MASSKQIVDGFKQAVTDTSLSGCWLSDEVVVSLLRYRYHFSGLRFVDCNQLNASLSRDTIFKHSYNDIHTDGLIRYQQVRKQILDLNGRKRTATFYYVLKVGQNKVEVPTQTELQRIYDNN